MALPRNRLSQAGPGEPLTGVALVTRDGPKRAILNSTVIELCWLIPSTFTVRRAALPAKSMGAEIKCGSVSIEYAQMPASYGEK